MASEAMLVGRALVNAQVFSGSNYVFSMLRCSDMIKQSSSSRLPKQNDPDARAMLFKSTRM